jgi:hypothetical protein
MSIKKDRYIHHFNSYLQYVKKKTWHLVDPAGARQGNWLGQVTWDHFSDICHNTNWWYVHIKKIKIYVNIKNIGVYVDNNFYIIRTNYKYVCEIMRIYNKIIPSPYY